MATKAMPRAAQPFSGRAPPAGTHAAPAVMEAPDPIEERIRLRAFQIYQARNGEPGDALGDWLRAESEIKKESNGDRLR